MRTFLYPNMASPCPLGSGRHPEVLVDVWGGRRQSLRRGWPGLGHAPLLQGLGRAKRLGALKGLQDQKGPGPHSMVGPDVTLLLLIVRMAI